MPWVEACRVDDILPDDVRRFDYDGRTFAIYRLADGTIHASDGHCTHEAAHLAEGFVFDGIIECPMHNGRFDIRTGKARGAPVCIDLEVYPVRLENGKVLIDIG